MNAVYSPDLLVLVNRDNRIPDGYADTIRLCDIEDTDGDFIKIEMLTGQAFGELQAFFAKQGIPVGIDSAYRSPEHQQEIIDEYIREFGEAFTMSIAARPGFSEHHTGLAVDIGLMPDGCWLDSVKAKTEHEPLFRVIHSSLHKFGFILRYPPGKEDITFAPYEPWHIRFVGREAAQTIYRQGICLEEFRSKMVRGIPFDTTLPKTVVTKAEAARALEDLFEQASDVPEMSLDEINAEIAAARLVRRKA